MAGALTGATLLGACTYEKSDPESSGTTTTTSAVLEDASTDDVSVPTEGCCDPGAGVLLTAVTTEAQPGVERVVFQFSNPIASYRVGYVPLPVTADGSGEPVALAGERALQVTMGATAFDGSANPPVDTYAGPRRIPVDGGSVVEVVQTGDFEALLTWAIGVNGTPPFRVAALTDPPRLAIEITTP